LKILKILIRILKIHLPERREEKFLIPKQKDQNPETALKEKIQIDISNRNFLIKDPKKEQTLNTTLQHETLQGKILRSA